MDTMVGKQVDDHMGLESNICVKRRLQEWVVLMLMLCSNLKIATLINQKINKQ